MSIQAIRSIQAVDISSVLNKTQSIDIVAPAMQQGGGMAPVAGEGGGGGGGSGGSSASTPYDVRDLNRDGIVSPMEELLYELMHKVGESESQSSASSSQIQAGLSTYQQATQAQGSIQSAA